MKDKIEITAYVSSQPGISLGRGPMLPLSQLLEDVEMRRVSDDERAMVLKYRQSSAAGFNSVEDDLSWINKTIAERGLDGDYIVNSGTADFSGCSERDTPYISIAGKIEKTRFRIFRG